MPAPAQPSTTIAVDLVLAHLVADELDLHQRIADLILQLDIERSMRSVLLAQLHAIQQRRRDAGVRQPSARAA